MSEVTLVSNGGFRVSENYNYYIPYQSNLITDYVEIINYTIGTSSSADTESERYTYDDNGNISAIETPRGNIQYVYDGLNRITQEINHVTNKKYNYTYDAGGNILTKKVTNLYTQAVEQQLNYVYDATFKDRLLSFGNETISGYDLQGRPTSYRGWNLTWSNGRVSSFTKNGSTHTCTYNANGIRIEKLASGLTHKYYLEDNKIVREVVQVGNNPAYELLFMYGTNGIVGFTHKTSTGSTNYYFRKNLQGDIVAVYGENGTKYAQYAYDAWGNCTVLSDTNGIGALNPFRYRGYYWDSELGLYNLTVRYYDPAVGRFISQDNIEYLIPEILNGINLFAYCLNNPVIYIDQIGRTPSFNISTEGFAVVDYESYTWISNRYVPKRTFQFGNGLSSFGNNLLYVGEFFLSGFELRLGREELKFFKLSSTGFTLLSLGYDWTEVRYYAEDDYCSIILLSINAQAGIDVEEGIGIDFEATICTVGFYSKYADVEVLLGSFSASAKYENGELKVGLSVGWGIQLTIKKWW